MLRGQRGQATIEYVGVAVVAGLLVAAIVAGGLPGRIGNAFTSAMCRVVEAGCPDAQAAGTGARNEPRAPQNAGGPDNDGDGVANSDELRAGSNPNEADTDLDGVPDGEDPSVRNRDADGDGLSDGEELALGSNPRETDSDGDGLSDMQEYEQGTDPAQAVAPVTDENRFKPWERVGMTEDEWREFEDAVLDEVNPGGWRGFLSGPAYWGVTLNDAGEIELMEIQQNGIGSGLVRIITGGGRAISAAQAAARALTRLPAAARARLARLGVVPGATRLARPPAPPAGPGTALGELDALGRPIGASATITRDMIGTGTRASSSLRPPGFGGQAAGHARSHLIGRQLGGSGSDPRNIVTLFQNPANTPAMSRFEGLVRGAVEAGETVRYTVTPIYRGSELVPRGVTMTARGSGGFRLDVTVLNRGR